MRLGVCILPEHPWAEGRRLWQRAEALGVAHGWTYDHLAWRDLRDSSWFAAVPTLTAAALATSSLRLGTLVASPNFRHPLSTVRELLALDDVSGGRFTFGVGAGGSGWDAEILGQPALSAGQRADRFEEFVVLADRLLREREVNHHGEYYDVVDGRTHPGCVQQPRVPFAIAATGPRGMRLAATYGQAWVTTGAPDGDVAGQVRRLEAACAEVGRDPATIDRLVLTGLHVDPGLDSPGHFADVLGGLAANGVTDVVVHWPRPAEPFAADPDVFETAVSSATNGA